MSFHVARSSVVMPLLVAIRYRLAPRLTTAVAPYLGVDTREPPSRTTELEQAARTSSASAARPATKMRDGVIPGRFGVIMRLAGLPSGQRRPRHPLGVQTIGRASWRARVCTYVSSLCVCVSLK